MHRLVTSVQTVIADGAKRPVRVLISSDGGSTTYALQAYELLQKHRGQIVTCNYGNVRSSANIVYCIGGDRCTLPGRNFFFHEVSHGNCSNPCGRTELLSAIEKLEHKAMDRATMDRYRDRLIIPDGDLLDGMRNKLEEIIRTTSQYIDIVVACGLRRDVAMELLGSPTEQPLQTRDARGYAGTTCTGLPSKACIPVV